MHARELEQQRRDEQTAAEPARLPVHALLALQRSAGNRAVAGMIARRTIKDGTIRRDVKEAIKGGHKTKDAVLLAIYNDMRLQMLTDEKVFAGVAAAAKKLIEAGKMDEEDATAYAAEAVNQLKRGDKPLSAAEQLKADVEEDRAGMSQTMFDHVLLGAWSKKEFRPTGYHSTKGGSTTHEAFGTKTAGENNTYQRSVRAIDQPANVKKTQSTFFPDSANAEDIKNAITSVYGKHGKAKGVRSVTYPESLKGIKLTQREGTAFPDVADPLEGEGYDASVVPKKR